MWNNFFYYFNSHVSILYANSALRLPRRLFSISKMTVGTKMEHFFLFWGLKVEKKSKDQSENWVKM